MLRRDRDIVLGSNVVKDIERDARTVNSAQSVWERQGSRLTCPSLLARRATLYTT